ncbi:MAG: ATP phosphoribosyltransferase [Bacteroidetes bacterium]|nr:ATP phosphoribosyltransferase [Bacteroidota bacterium]
MKLKIAIQKSGRLYDESVELIRSCGIQISNPNGRLKTEASNFPLELLFLRDDDIPQYVEDGVADAGIVGENVLLEKQKSVVICNRLGFGRCRLSIAVNKSAAYKSLDDLQGKKIATSYPMVLTNFLRENGIDAEIHEISGSVEIAPGIGLADAICDLVSTGSTLLSNGLREADVILRSEALLIANNQLQDFQNNLLRQLIFRIEALRKARNNKYILLNAPNEQLPRIAAMIPGMKSPTILPLAQPGWSSLHSVVDENEFWSITENLKQCGAQGILVIPIEKMIL